MTGEENVRQKCIICKYYWVCQCVDISQAEESRIRYCNPLPDDKILPLSKLKAIADDYLNFGQNIKFVSHRVGNIAGKGENSGYQLFLPFLVYCIYIFILHRLRNKFLQLINTNFSQFGLCSVFSLSSQFFKKVLVSKVVIVM